MKHTRCRRIFAVVALLCLLPTLVFGLTSCGYRESKEPTNYVCLDVKDYGKVVIELYPDTASQTVANFKKLVSEGFYDGTVFHRVIEEFMIQGGGFDATVTQKKADTIVGEFLSNGYLNELKHTPGVVSMARSNAPDSASSQFFICTSVADWLDGDYAAFGKVVEGMDVVYAIEKVATGVRYDARYYPHSDWPTADVVITRAYFVK